jgi:hypothetical protein
MMNFMNRCRFQIMGLLRMGLLLAVLLQTSAIAGLRDAQWQVVQDAVKKGLPQTALTNLEPIINAAMKEKAYAEATKAIGEKIALEGNIQGNKAEERVMRLEAEIANPPRFLREGDTLEFSVKISNQSDQPQRGAVKLVFSDAATQQSVDTLFGNSKPELAFDIPAKESRSYSWRISVPDGAPFLVYKAVASTGTLSDGEEGYLPVLSRRIFVTESLPLPIHGKVGGGEVVKKFEFTKLLNSGKSSTLQNESLTVQMVSQPAWYAVLALPYLMEFPYECSE